MMFLYGVVSARCPAKCWFGAPVGRSRPLSYFGDLGVYEARTPVCRRAANPCMSRFTAPVSIHRPQESDRPHGSSICTYPPALIIALCLNDQLVGAFLSPLLVLWQSEANMPPSSSYRGVHWCKETKKWHASIMRERINVYLGSFTDEVEAAKAYDR
jgi:hypothetical protein